MLNPLMLLGLLGLAVPIIIHLIQKQRLKPQFLSTTQFLDREDIANAFAPVPRDPLQLLLRLLMLGLFIFLMSRLVVGSREAGPRTLAIILDHSMSMQQKAIGGGSIFDRSKKQILELISGLRPEDSASLMLVGDKITQETGYLNSKQQLRAVVEKYQVSDSGALALVPAIRAAVDQLRSRREVNACVVVFSDHQRINYQSLLNDKPGAAEEPKASLNAALAGGDVKLVLIDEPSEQSANVAIERAAFSPERVHVGASSRVTAVMRNYSDEPQTARVSVKEGQQTGPERAVALAPGEIAQVDLVQRFESPVDTTCAVEIEDDALSGDNHFHLPMRMKDRRQILLVAPPATREDEESTGLELNYRGVDLLTYALNPGEALGQGTGTYINVKRVTPAALVRLSLPIYSLVIISGVTDLAEQSIKDLEAFVNNGGGVWLMPGQETSPLRFNEQFGTLLNGLAIGQLKQPSQVQPVGRSEQGLTHGMLLPLIREEWGATNDIFFSQYYGIESPGTAAVALRTASGDPLMEVIRRGRGQVLVQLFSPELEASSLARSPAFVPLIQQVSAALSDRGEQPRPDAMRVGDVLRMQLPEYRNLKGEVQVTGPAERKYKMTGAEGDEVRVEGLVQAGSYSVEHLARKGGRKRWLTVNPVAGESELTPLDEAEQANAFGDNPVHRIPYTNLAGEFSNRHEIGRWILVLLLLAFAVEAIMGAWQSRQGARRDVVGEATA